MSHLSHVDFDLIAEVITPEELADWANLDRAGSSKCPFHDDKRASFSIFRQHGRTGAKCHGECDQYWTPVQLYIEVFGVSYREAGEALAEFLGLT